MLDIKQFDYMSQVELDEILNQFTEEDFSSYTDRINFKSEVQKRHDDIMVIKGEHEMVKDLSGFLKKLKLDHRLNELTKRSVVMPGYYTKELLEEYHIVDYKEWRKLYEQFK